MKATNVGLSSRMFLKIDFESPCIIQKRRLSISSDDNPQFYIAQ